MIMKVKKSQRTVASFDQSYAHLCYCIVYALLMICLIDFGWHRMYANAYVHRADNLTNSFRQYRPHVRAINASLQDEWFHKRDGRFLFDAFFGIDTPPIEADDLEDEDEEETVQNTCKCGNNFTSIDVNN